MITLLNTGVATLGVVPEIPQDAYDLEISELNRFYWYDPFLGKSDYIELPPGNWSILGWSDEITEEQAKGLVEFKFGNQKEMLESGYPDYTVAYKKHFDAALESFNSWLLSNNITTRTFLLLKK